MIATFVIILYLCLLLGLGIISNRFLKSTSQDFFVASHSIGPFLLLMSVFGTTMTAFAMVGSTGQAFHYGIGVYGKMASWSGLIHSACFFLVGIKLWAIGKKYGIYTQCQYFRDRFESNGVGYVLFPVLVILVIPYLLIGLLGAGAVVRGITAGAFPEIFPDTNGAIPPYITSGVICLVVLFYVFSGGLRAAAWANTFQTLVFMFLGLITFLLISNRLGGFQEASQMADPAVLVRGDLVPPMQFLTYCFIPFSVGMFPHLFQHWLTARSAKTFRLTLIAHPICIMLVWIPCILIGIWATGAVVDGEKVIPEGVNPNQVLGLMVATLENELLMGLLTAGILAAIMSSMDSQFLCLGTMFTNDVVFHYFGKERFTEKQKILLARGFIVAIVFVTYLFTLGNPVGVFNLGVWCFTGFASLFPLVFAAVYWKRATKAGAYATILVTALTWFLFFRASEYGLNEDFLVFGMQPVAIIFTCSALTMYLTSLFTQPPSEETIKRYFTS